MEIPVGHCSVCGSPAQAGPDGRGQCPTCGRECPVQVSPTAATACGDLPPFPTRVSPDGPPPPPPAPPPQANRTFAIEGQSVDIPGYQVLGEIGHGGMGYVYRARCRATGQIVAVKVLSQKLAAKESYILRFRREARAQALANHPNVIRVLDHGESDGLLFFTMEYVDGTSLRPWIQNGEFTGRQLHSLIVQTCNAVAHIHRQGLIHRDLKPENILIDSRGSVKLGDFGLVDISAADGGEPNITRTRAVLGTLYYMAPEQAADSSRVTPRVDIYSLGVILYELLTRKLPIGRFEPPSWLNPLVEPKLDDAILRALEVDPSARHASASEFLAALEAAFASVPQDRLDIAWGPAAVGRELARLRSASGDRERNTLQGDPYGSRPPSARGPSSPGPQAALVPVPPQVPVPVSRPAAPRPAGPTDHAPAPAPGALSEYRPWTIEAFCYCYWISAILLIGLAAKAGASDVPFAPPMLLLVGVAVGSVLSLFLWNGSEAVRKIALGLAVVEAVFKLGALDPSRPHAVASVLVDLFWVWALLDDATATFCRGDPVPSESLVQARRRPLAVATSCLLVALLFAKGPADRVHPPLVVPTVEATGPAPPRTPGGPPAEVIRAAAAVVTVRAMGDDGLREGPGFPIEDGRSIATSAHMLFGAKEIRVIAQGSDERRRAAAWSIDRQRDLSIVRVDSREELAPLELGDADALRRDGEVFAVGTPVGGQPQVAGGVVRDKRRIRESLFIVTSVPPDRVKQGAPLVGPDGRVVGICRVVQRISRDASVALAVNHLRDLARRAARQPAPDSIDLPGGQTPGAGWPRQGARPLRPFQGGGQQGPPPQGEPPLPPPQGLQGPPPQGEPPLPPPQGQQGPPPLGEPPDLQGQQGPPPEDGAQPGQQPVVK